MGTPLEVTLGAILLRLQMRLAVAESCTGGLLAHRITNVPGSSAYFMGGVIAYDNEVKLKQLSVELETLVKYGAVSEACVLEMAQGARQAMDAQLGLSVSGIAGPGGGTPEKPVGLVWIGLSSPRGDLALRFQLAGDRFSVKEQATEAALRALIDYLHQVYPDQVEGLGDGAGVAAGQTGTRETVQPTYKSVEVRARYKADGRPIPRSFTLDGQIFRVDSLGRRWEDALGQHFLVMDPDRRVFELVYAPLEQAWYLAQAGGVRLTV